MTVGLLLISHEGLGAALLECSRVALGRCPLPVRMLYASRDCDPAKLLKEAEGLVAALDTGSGVLVLTDLYGATPCNIAARLVANPGIRVVSGMNLPMLIRVLNYPNLDLDTLADKAVTGGQDGVMRVTQED